MTSKANSIPLPSSIQKELQRVAAAVTYNLVMQTFDVTNEKQKKLMESYFHGDDDKIASQASMLANGEAGTVYQSLYESVTAISLDKTDQTGATQKKLKEIFSWEPHLNYFVRTHIKPNYIKLADRKIGSSKIEG